VGVLCASVAGVAAEAASEPVLLMHVTEADASFCDLVDDRSLRCSGIVTSAPSGGPYFVWVLMGDVSDVGGVQFGIEYESAIQILSWTSCAGGLQMPSASPPWPASGSGNAITWTEGCYRPGPGGFAKVGFFLLGGGSSGWIGFAPDPRHHESGLPGYQYSNCDGDTPDMCEYHGRAAIGGGTGAHPRDCECSGPPVTERSWSTIKDTYR
jgi:hypothetical protein